MPRFRQVVAARLALGALVLGALACLALGVWLVLSLRSALSA